MGWGIKKGLKGGRFMDISIDCKLKCLDCKFFVPFLFCFNDMDLRSHLNGMEVHPRKFIKSQNEIKFIQEIKYIISFHP
jgi:hypothetical protein